MSTERRPRREADELSPDETPAPGGVGETLAQRLGRCIERLEDPSLQPAWVVHEVRKDLKRTRALLRLCGEVLPTRRLEKRCGAAGRQLAPLRDADAAGETVARLRLRADARQLEALEAVAQWFARRHATLAGAPGLARPIAMAVAGELRGVARDVQALPFERVDAAALDAGLADAWAETANAFRHVAAKPVLPRFHDFRKAVKRELHQRELSGRPPDRMERATLKKLADVLGELQDLDVLRDTLRAAGRWRGPVRGLVRQTISELKARAIRLGDGRYRDNSR
ncbi:MAG TPA: CHAD domain-containing protein [Gammaproteobacteria bacterium]|nr:CHAD domain-containing protein [Gammaproteobacteria bacterium]